MRREVRGKNTVKLLKEQQRRAIFHALVEIQDTGMAVAASKAKIASRFRIPEGQLDLIVDEAIRHDWPLPPPPPCSQCAADGTACMTGCSAREPKEPKEQTTVSNARDRRGIWAKIELRHRHLR
jgi:hypothetical protein